MCVGVSLVPGTPILGAVQPILGGDVPVQGAGTCQGRLPGEGERMAVSKEEVQAEFVGVECEAGSGGR